MLTCLSLRNNCLVHGSFSLGEPLPIDFHPLFRGHIVIFCLFGVVFNPVNRTPSSSTEPVTVPSKCFFSIVQYTEIRSSICTPDWFSPEQRNAIAMLVNLTAAQCVIDHRPLSCMPLSVRLDTSSRNYRKLALVDKFGWKGCYKRWQVL